jgi:hypothetical protein
MLSEYYIKAEKLGGIKAKMRLAMLTKVPSNNAASLPDSSDNVKIFENAMNEIRKEFS